MRIGTAIAEGFAYLTGVILSCGPSQLFGLIKGTIDLIRLTSIQSKLSRYSEEAKRIELLSLSGQKGLEKQNVRMLSKLAKYESRYNEKVRDLKADAIALIPLLGAILSWRMYAKEPSMGNVGMFEYALPQMFGDHKKTFAGLIFYPISGMDYPICKSNHTVKIPVQDVSKTRELDARLYQHDPLHPRETIVLFHANAMTCDGMGMYARYYLDRGYDVLAPTLGGYAGSDFSVRTCEASTYRDLEGIKLYLDMLGVKKAGYHGFSIGGSLAFQAAAAPSQAKVETAFVVADQTFTTGMEVAANVVTNGGAGAIAPLARGTARAALPEGEKIIFSKKVSVTTDGLDNRKKAALMKKANIPLFVIKVTDDMMMGKGKRDSNGRYESNFADDLMDARYGKEAEAMKASNMAAISGGHCTFFGTNHDATSKLDEFLKQQDQP